MLAEYRAKDRAFAKGIKSKWDAKKLGG